MNFIDFIYIIFIILGFTGVGMALMFSVFTIADEFNKPITAFILAIPFIAVVGYFGFSMMWNAMELSIGKEIPNYIFVYYTIFFYLGIITLAILIAYAIYEWLPFKIKLIKKLNRRGV